MSAPAAIAVAVAFAGAVVAVVELAVRRMERRRADQVRRNRQLIRELQSAGRFDMDAEE